MKGFLFAAIGLAFLQTQAQTSLSIIPAPVKVDQHSGSFSLNSQTVIINADANNLPSIQFLNNYLRQYYGFSLRTVKKSAKNFIRITSLSAAADDPRQEGYTLQIRSGRIEIKGNSAAGAFYGIQTLIQLLPVQKANSLLLPAVSIDDYPRFGYRGALLDVCRHFFDTDYIKKYLDLLALHKINTFHWHLTDDQGWRIEIKKYPRLATVGGCRNGTIIGRYPGTGNDGIKYCGYYTQEQIKEIVRYAAERFITVIPEIEMPGHASAAIAAYPQLSCFPDEPTRPAKYSPWYGDSTTKNVQQGWGVFRDVYCPSEYSFHFLEDVLDEVMQLFPSKYIHIGGDECPKDSWKRSAFCQNLIKEKDLKDEHGLQSYFVGRIEKYLNSKGRAIIGWDEILEGGLAPNATVMSWRGEKGGIEAAKLKHDVIMTPNSYLYLDYAQRRNEDSLVIGGYLPLEKVYSFDPVPKELADDEHHYILGAQGNLWTEYIPNISKLEYMLFPRLSALSEVAWSEKKNKDWDGFKKSMNKQFQRYKLWKVNYYPNLNEPVN